MFLLAVMLFHPSTPSFMGGLAHLAVYFAVMAPLFWAPAFVRTPEHLARILWMLLVCCGVNAIVGVLQVYDPSVWLPAEFSRVVTAGNMGLGPVSYMGPNGQHDRQAAGAVRHARLGGRSRRPSRRCSGWSLPSAPSRCGSGRCRCSSRPPASRPFI